MEESNFIFEYTNSNIKDIVDEKYDYYINEIKPLQIEINGIIATWKSFPMYDGKDGTYFHLITKDYQNKDGYCCPNLLIKCDKNFDYNPMMNSGIPDNKKRTICGHRIQCLYLIPEMLFEDNNNLLIWSREESTPQGRRTRIKILDENRKYFIVFDKRNTGKMVYWTSYPVNTKKIEKFKKEASKNNSTRYILKTTKKTGDAKPLSYAPAPPSTNVDE